MTQVSSGGRDAEAAARRFQARLATDPCNLEALCGLGRLALKAGQGRQAVRHLSIAARLRPDDPAIAKLLGLAQASIGDFTAAALTFERLVALAPSDAEARGNLGNVYKRLGRLDDALESYRASLALRPNAVELHINLAGVLIALEQWQVAATACRQALALGPTPPLLSKLVTLLLEAGDAEGALQACERLKVLQPGWAGVMAHEALALQELGREADAQRLLDYRRLVQVLPIHLPPGTAALTRFNSDLAAAVKAHDSLAYAPAGKATHGGSQSGELLGSGPLFEIFEAALRDGIARYVAALPWDPAHPFLAQRLRDYALTAWGVVLDSGGHQQAHVHPSGWLSGVYYVTLPEDMDGADADPQSGDPQAGWLEFGPADPRYRLTRPGERFAVRPEPGSMVIFPSYFWHGTRPFADRGQRISIAFDVWGES